MSDILDSILLVGMGIEKKVKESLDDLRKSGQSEGGEEADDGEGKKGLSPKQRVENKLVGDGIGVVKEILSVVDGAKTRIEEEIESNSGRIRGKLHAADSDEIEVIKEMARVAREKVDVLEKRVNELEAIVKKDKK